MKKIVVKTSRAMEIVVKCTSPQYFGDFSSDDCVIFGGDVAGTTFVSANLWGIVVTSLVVYLLM